MNNLGFDAKVLTAAQLQRYAAKTKAYSHTCKLKQSTSTQTSI